MQIYQGDLKNSFGNKGTPKPAFNLRNELSKVDYSNYIPAMGRARAVKYPSPQEIAQGAKEFELEIAKHAANMRNEALQRMALARQQAAKLAEKSRAYNQWLSTTPQQRALPKVLDFRVNAGKIVNPFWK
jgi:hypothetical protein